MHVRAKLRQFLREDEVQKPIESKSWFLIRSDHDIQLASQEILEKHVSVVFIDFIVFQESKKLTDPAFKMEKDVEIGDQITVDNVTGELLCSSNSGFGVMDIFNYVLTEISDMKSFLGLDNCEARLG